jgi:predicted transcriptional regulator of viral defense system
MKSYEIVETLRKSRKAVFTPKDIAKITELKGSEVYVLISRLYKKGMIFKALANLRNSSLVVEFSRISCTASANQH